MATYNYESWENANPMALPDYLPMISDRFTRQSENVVSVNNGDAIITVTQSSFQIDVNGVTILDWSGDYDDDFNIKIVAGDRFIYFKTYARDSNPYDIVSFAWFLDDNDNVYIGYNSTNNGDNKLEVRDLAFIKASTGGGGYFIPQLINFTAGAGKVAYSSKAPITNGGAIAVFPDELYSCSNMASETNVALPNGDTFITVGTNNMIALDV
jgi:hypothetical protein